MELEQAQRVPVVVLPPPTLALPLRARGAILHGIPFLLFLLFGCALLPVAAFRDTSTTQGHLELPRCESKHQPRPSSPELSELAGAREGAGVGAGAMEVPESVGDSEMKMPSM